MSRAALLAEIENILETMPPRATIRHTDNPENLKWFGRVAAAIEKWNPSKSSLAKGYRELFFSNGHARLTAPGLTNLLTLLEEARSELKSEATGTPNMVETMNKKIFIGHGRSNVWYQLKEFLNNRLHLQCDDFSAEEVAGISTTARLQTMLDGAWFAFLVMTAEDDHADNTYHARENVIHEAGLFQGRLGFERAIILLEQGCAQFSNIHGLTHIPFPKDNLEPAFEKIRRVLEREGAQQFAPGAETASVAEVEGETCPKCLKKGWHIASSTPDSIFGALGVASRDYKCDICGFTERKLVET